MIFSETFTEYWPSMLIGLKETGIMMSISMAICLLVGLSLGLGLFLANSKVKGYQPWLCWVLNFTVTVIYSSPYLLFMTALTPATRSALGKASGPVPLSVPLSIVATAIFARLVGQVLLDVSEEIYFLANSLGTSEVRYIWHFLLVETRGGLALVYTATVVSMAPYSAVMGIVGGDGVGDLIIRVGYQRYEYGIMYVIIVVMTTLVFILQMLGNFITQKLDKRK